MAMPGAGIPGNGGVGGTKAAALIGFASSSCCFARVVYVSGPNRRRVRSISRTNALIEGPLAHVSQDLLLVGGFAQEIICAARRAFAICSGRSLLRSSGRLD